MRIKISSDSTFDLSEDLIEKYDIGVIPLMVVKDGVPYRDLLEITPEDIFAHVAAGGDLCSTSAANYADYFDAFSNYLKEYDAVIHISLSKEMSTSYQNACLAANDLKNVYVVDSMNLSSGQGLVVLKAADLAAEGLEPYEIFDKLNEFTPLVEASFIVDRLDYLRKGGRCSSLAAFGANLFNIKPSIEVINGKMIPGKKYRGLFERCTTQYIHDKLSGRTDIDTKRLMFTMPPSCPDHAVSAGHKAISDCGVDFENVHTTHAGCVISAHCGPHCLGVLFVRKK